MRELREYAKDMSAAELLRQLGPFALVQRPTDARVAQLALKLGAKRTVAVKRGALVEDDSLLLEFEDLVVATLPPVSEGAVLTVGRLPDCDLVVDDPSVSKRHANIHWLADEQRAAVEDLKSSNGTLLNGDELHMRMYLKDGDNLTFGDARFCFLLTAALHRKLTRPR
ncbi:MAG: FHA domain-containing protein [Myxococcota bacterium]